MTTLHEENMRRVFDIDVKIPDFDSRPLINQALSVTPLSGTYSKQSLDVLGRNITSIRIFKRVFREFLSGIDWEGNPVSTIVDLLNISERYNPNR